MLMYNSTLYLQLIKTYYNKPSSLFVHEGGELPPARAGDFLRVRRTPRQQDEGELSFYH